MPIRIPFCHFAPVLFVTLLSLASTGCAKLPASADLPAGITLASRMTVAADSPVAWDATGAKVAIVRDRLYRWTPETGETLPLAEVKPTALAWSPDGEQLAAVLPAGADSRLLLLSATGELLREMRIVGRVSQLAWRTANDLLFISANLKEYKFGGNFALQLYRWPTTGEPTGELLYETTLMPRTVRQWGKMLPDTAIFSLAPLGDAILFARLRDPPAFSPYLEIVLHHLGTGGEQAVTAQLPLTAGRPLFAADSEAILFGDGNRTRMHDPWAAKDLESYALPGQHLALSPGGQYLFVDGHLYREGERMAEFPAATEGWFSPVGDRLLLRQRNKLLLFTGLTEPALTGKSAPAQERLLLLRRWRSSGLITHSEFLQQSIKDASQ